VPRNLRLAKIILEVYIPCR